MRSNGNNLNVEWRRNKVLELSSQGFTQSDIATVLHVTQPTVNKDLVHIRQQAQENLQKHIHETVPEEYQKCMIRMKRNLKQTLEIAESAADPKTKLQARAIVTDIYRYIMDLCTNSGIVSEAMKYVTQTQEKINTLHKLDEKIDAIEEETTTNGVF